MSRILHASGVSKMNSSLLYSLNAKLAQRMTKLNFQEHEDWLSSVFKESTVTSKLLEDRWSAILEDDDVNYQEFPSMSEFDLKQDYAIRLPYLDHFIRSISRREMIRSSAVFKPRSEVLTVASDFLPAISSVDRDNQYAIHSLGLFED